MCDLPRGVEAEWGVAQDALISLALALAIGNPAFAADGLAGPAPRANPTSNTRADLNSIPPANPNSSTPAAVFEPDPAPIERAVSGPDPEPIRSATSDLPPVICAVRRGCLLLGFGTFLCGIRFQ